MARQHDIRYINSYVSGNVAYQLEPKANRPADTAQLPKLPKLPKNTQPRKQKERLLCVEPLAVCAIAVAAVLLVMLVSGVVQFVHAREEVVALEQYVQRLEAENAQLQDTYSSGYDLAEIEEMALAMGMIPIEEAEHIQISVSMPVKLELPQEMSAWDHVVSFLTGLFA